MIHFEPEGTELCLHNVQLVPTDREGPATGSSKTYSMDSKVPDPVPNTSHRRGLIIITIPPLSLTDWTPIISSPRLQSDSSSSTSLSLNVLRKESHPNAILYETPLLTCCPIGHQTTQQPYILREREEPRLQACRQWTQTVCDINRFHTFDLKGRGRGGGNSIGGSFSDKI